MESQEMLEMMIPSKTVRDYLTETGYKFRDRDVAALICNCWREYPVSVILDKLKDIMERTDDGKLKKEIRELLEYEAAKLKSFQGSSFLAVYMVITSGEELERGAFQKL